MNLRGLLHPGALAKLCIRPLCHLSIKLAEAVGIEPTRVYDPSCFQDSFLDLPDYFHKIWVCVTTPERSITLKDHTTKYDFKVTFKLVGIEGLEPPWISPRASKTHVSAISPYAHKLNLRWSATPELNWLHMLPKHVCYFNTYDRLIC